MTESDWLTSTDPDAMLQDFFEGSRRMLDRTTRFKISDRKLRLFACACCRLAWDKLMPSCKAAIQQAERFADREITGDAFYRAREACSGGTPINYVWNALAPDAASGASNAIARIDDLTFPDARVGKMRKALAHLLRCIVGNPFRPVVLLKERPHCPHCGAERWSAIDVDEMACLECHKRFRWQPDWLKCPYLTPRVVAIAKRAYDERPGRKCVRCKGVGKVFVCSDTDAFVAGDCRCDDCHGTGRIADGHLDPDTLGVLADALSDSGCDNEDILMHLRGKERCPKCFLTPGRTLIPGSEYGFQTFNYGCCLNCHGSAWVASPCPHVRGDWVIDLLTGRE